MKIPIKKFVDDTTQTWEERFKKLLAHHEEETKWMFGELQKLESSQPLAQLKEWLQKEFEQNRSSDLSALRHAEKATEKSEVERWHRISRDSYTSWITIREVIRKITELEEALAREGRHQE